jgi:hypothetical protein
LLPFAAALKEGAYYVIAIVLCVIAVRLSRDSSSFIIKTLAALSFFVMLLVSVILIAWSIVVIAFVCRHQQRLPRGYQEVIELLYTPLLLSRVTVSRAYRVDITIGTHVTAAFRRS